MKAVVCTAYGGPEVLQLQDVAQPIPKPNEILVKVQAVHINFGDLYVRNFKEVTPREFSMPSILWIPTRLTIGLRKPNVKIHGSEFSGEVAAIGAEVSQFKVGDEVFGYLAMKMGANAEYLVIAEDGLVLPKPTNMTHAEAATVPYGALTALSLLRKANIQPGQKVLINGASGSIGAYALQLAKYYGAEVIGVCSTPRVEFVKSLGADHVIDYKKEDFTQNGEKYDLIMDIVRKTSFGACKNSLTATGIYLLVSFKTRQLLQMLRTSFGKGPKVICALSGENHQDFVEVKDLVEAGHLKTMIDKEFPLNEIVAAHRYIESGQPTARVVIRVNGAN